MLSISEQQSNFSLRHAHCFLDTCSTVHLLDHSGCVWTHWRLNRSPASRYRGVGSLAVVWGGSTSKVALGPPQLSQEHLTAPNHPRASGVYRTLSRTRGQGDADSPHRRLSGGIGWLVLSP